MAVDDQYTKSLLHFDGGITDESGKVWTAYGGAATSTTWKKFGTHSLDLVSASSQYISTTAHADFNFGTGDFTIDFWAYGKTGGQGSFATFGTNTSDGNYTGGFALEISTSRAPQFWFNRSPLAEFGAATITMPKAWEHWALTRSGSNLRLFRNGTQVGATATNSTNITSANPFSIGFYGNPYYTTNAYIDEYRVSKGIARWTANPLRLAQVI